MENRQEMEAELRSLCQRVAELLQDDPQEAGRQRLLALFDAMFEGIQIVDFEYRLVYLNDAATRHTGTASREGAPKPLSEIFPGIERTEMFEHLKACMQNRHHAKLPGCFYYPNHEQRWLELSFTPIPAGVLILSVDVTAQKLAQEDMAATLDCLAEGLLTTDLQGRITRMNPAAERLTGWSAGEAQGLALDELIRLCNPTSGLPIEEPFNKLLTENHHLGIAEQVILAKRDGDECPIEYSTAPLSANGGEVRGVVVALRDMTEESRLNSLLQQAQKMEAVGRLAGGIAHDFNNYLMMITGYCQLVRERLGDGHAASEDLEQIAEAAHKAATLTAQLLAFSRQKVLRPEVLNVNEIIRDIEKMLKRLIGEDIRFNTCLDSSLHSVEFDPGQIEQIVVNLAVNARDAMPNGGHLTIETKNVSLDHDYVELHGDARVGPHVMISVTDDGEGMPPEVRDKIFDPFFTTKGSGKGTGLGLSTVYGIVKQSGGNIWVYSEVEHGTTFKIYLPSVDTDAVATPRDSAGDSEGAAETILVVEDEPGLRALLSRMLESSGYHVLLAESPDDAIRLCEDFSGEIDMLLTDVVMPVMDGVTLSGLAAKLRPDMKIVYMSGYSDMAVAQKGDLESGSGFIEKPVAKDVLLAKIREFFS